MTTRPQTAFAPPDRPRTAAEARWYVVALALTVLVRAAAVIGTDSREVFIRWSRSAGAPPLHHGGLVGDPELYDRFGWNLAEEGTLGVGSRPSAFSLPGYPLLLAGVYEVAGHSPGAARWAQVFVNALAVLFLGALARRLAGPRAEVLCLLAGGLYPFYVYFVREIMTETLFLCAFAAMLLTAYQVGHRGRKRDGVLYGLAVSVAVMTRPVGAFLVPGTLILARPWAAEGRRRRLGGLLLGALLLEGVWGSWIQRNERVFGETVVLDTHGGFGLYLGQLQARGVTIDEAVRIVGYHHADILNGSLPGGPRGEIEADRSAAERALKMIRGDPAAFATAVLSNVRGLWLGLDFSDLAGHGGMQVLMTLAAGAAYLPVLALGLLGIGLSGRTGRREIFWACVVLLATTTLLHAVVLGGKRYRTVTIDPVLMVAAACQVARFLARYWPEPLAGPQPAKTAAG